MTTIERRFPHVSAGAGRSYSLIGELITFKLTAAETGDTFLLVELISQPGGGPPLHTHAAAEICIILEGEFQFTGLDRDEPYTIQAAPGDIVYIPGAAAHTYKTVGTTPGKAFGLLLPGGAMESFFAEVGVPVNDRSNQPAPAGPPSQAELARHIAIAGRHGITFFPPQHAAGAAPGTTGESG